MKTHAVLCSWRSWAPELFSVSPGQVMCKNAGTWRKTWHFYGVTEDAGDQRLSSKIEWRGWRDHFGGEEHLLPFQRTRAQFLVPIWGSSPLPITPNPRNLIPSFGFRGHLQTCVHTHMYTHPSPHPHRKRNPKGLIEKLRYRDIGQDTEVEEWVSPQQLRSCLPMQQDGAWRYTDPESLFINDLCSSGLTVKWSPNAWSLHGGNTWEGCGCLGGEVLGYWGKWVTGGSTWDLKAHLHFLSYAVLSESTCQHPAPTVVTSLPPAVSSPPGWIVSLWNCTPK